MPPYIKAQRGGAGRPRGGAPGGVLLLPGVGLPPFLVGIGFAEGGKEEREEEGGRPPLLVLFGPKGGRGTQTISGHLSSLPLRPTKAHIPPGGFR